MINYKDENDYIIITDKPVNLTTIIAALLIFDVTLFFLDSITLLSASIFAIPLCIAYFFLKTTTTTIVKETLDCVIESQYFFNTSSYHFNLNEAKVEIAFVSKFFKGNAVILVNETHPINTPDVQIPYSRDLEAILKQINHLKTDKNNVTIKE